MNQAGEAESVLDASAVLALVLDERGAHRVDAALRRGALVSAVNWAEVMSDMAERGEETDFAAPRIKRLVEELGKLTIVPFDEMQADETARFRLRTRHVGLSLADRACLALARLHRLPVLTTDRAWRSLRISVRIEVIR